MTAKRDCDHRSDLEVLREFATYPGHPITLALVIVRTHESFAEANRKERDFVWPHAVGCNAVPGAGGNVHAAMNLLARWARNEAPLDKLFELADNMWERCDGQKDGGGSFAKNETEREKFMKRWREGQDQADRFKGPLVEALKEWPKG